MEYALFAACQFVQSRLDWRSAVRLACHPLEQQGKVSAAYADAIIQATEQSGPWYILSPEFALPHARPDEGVLSKESALSVVCCGHSVAFPEHPDVRLIIVLAAADSDQHIEMIQRLVCWLDEGNHLQQLTTVANQTQFTALMAAL